MTTNTREFTKNPIFTAWLNVSKKGEQYISGRTAEGEKLVGFINSMKNNPKEPDMRFYKPTAAGLGKEFFSLWVNVSKNGKKYLTGKIDGNRVVGFINSKATPGGKIPYFNVYESDSEPQKAAEPAPQEEMDLPFA